MSEQKSKIADLVIRKLKEVVKDKYEVRYKEKIWRGLYACSVRLVKNDIPVVWFDWFETYDRKIAKNDWVLIIPNALQIPKLITWEEIEKLSILANEINEELGIWYPKKIIRNGEIIRLD
jgi:hypothetical protein